MNSIRNTCQTMCANAAQDFVSFASSPLGKIAIVYLVYNHAPLPVVSALGALYFLGNCSQPRQGNPSTRNVSPQELKAVEEGMLQSVIEESLRLNPKFQRNPATDAIDEKNHK